MRYVVKIQPSASAEIDRFFVQIATEAPETARRWFDGLAQSIESLAVPVPQGAGK
ncbi:MAG: type II toxin-antitoxin system RelE/ParE family toxin [Acidobacteriota bacterium]